MLNEIKSIKNKIMTIENPIEYQIPLVQQAEIDNSINYTFYEAIKNFLRQDPDIMMIGETRDLETLNAVTQASLSGHLIMTTLHSNDAIGSILRIVQMGLEPYLIADALLAIVAQRLVRVICPYCKCKTTLDQKTLTKLNHIIPQNSTFYEGIGCSKCSGIGYLGRTLITEIIRIDKDIAELISKGASRYQIEDLAIEKKLYKPMLYDGINKAIEGITTIEEIFRVTRQ